MTITTATRACIVRENIAAGYGVEDIAVMYGIPLAECRYIVFALRESGQVAHMFPRKGAVQ